MSELEQAQPRNPYVDPRFYDLNPEAQRRFTKNALTEAEALETLGVEKEDFGLAEAVIGLDRPKPGQLSFLAVLTMYRYFHVDPDKSAPDGGA